MRATSAPAHASEHSLPQQQLAALQRSMCHLILSVELCGLELKPAKPLLEQLTSPFRCRIRRNHALHQRWSKL
jgi:hypothetical protein